MGAREDLLEAARALTRRGRTPFSPAELIAEARARGCGYPDSTLRTFIGGPMCENSPEHHAVQYGDLRRVAHGRYQLAGHSDPSEKRRPRPQPVTAPPDITATSGTPARATEEWSWEGNVQAAVVHHLATSGWRVHRVADTASREHGVDVEARRDDQRLVVEVKGYPSATHVRGPKQGTPKAANAPVQARAYFSHAVLAGLLMRTDHPDAHVALAFPDVQTYRSLAERTAAPLRSAGIQLWLVAQAGDVTPVGSDTEGP